MWNGGQWAFGGIEQENSRNCFLVAVGTRDEATLLHQYELFRIYITSLLPIIQKWIEPGTIIVSDYWKAYCNLEKHGYVHTGTVNHSKEKWLQHQHKRNAIYLNLELENIFFLHIWQNLCGDIPHLMQYYETPRKGHSTINLHKLIKSKHNPNKKR